MMNKLRINIVNSAYNPSGNWVEQYIAHAKEYIHILPQAQVTFILVDDGSKVDLTNGIKQIEKVLPNFKFEGYSQNKGKGYALRKGILSQEADYYCYTDIDFPYDSQSLKAMVDKIVTKKADVVIGKRNEEYFRSIPIQRKLISKTLITFNRYLLRLPFPDTQAGIKLINHKAAILFSEVKSQGFLFEVEFIKKATQNLHIEEVEVNLRKDIALNSISVATLIRLFKEYIKL